MSKEQEPYIYTVKAILDMNEIYDSGDCEQIRRGIPGERSSEPLPKYVALDEYRKLETEVSLYKTPEYKLAEQVDPAVFANRLISLGWQDTPFSTDRCLIIQLKQDGHLKHQANIPTNREMADYIFTMRVAAEEFADYLKQSTKQVLVELVLASKNSKETTGAKQP